MDDHRRLLDRIQVEELMSRYTWAIDGQDWEDIAGLVTEDVVADYRNLAGDDALLNGADELRGWLEKTLGWRENSLPWHFVSNHVIDLQGDVAQSKHYLHNRHMTVWGTYFLECRRGPDGWRISKLTLKAILRREPLPAAPVGPPAA